jgi:hypothetical protein
MAFQKGSQIRPELMRGDMSGFAQAAQFKAQEGQMWGQAMQNLGEQIGGVIKQKQVKEEQKKKDEAAVNILIANGIAPADAKAAVGSGMADTILEMSQQEKKMKAQAQQDAATAAHRASVLQGQAGQLKVAQEAEARLGAASTATQVNEAARLKMAQDAANRPVDPMVAAQAQADLDKTKAATAEATARTGQVGQMSTAERVKLMGTVVDDVSFGDYLQTLKKVDEYDGGREWNVKGSVFDKKQIAAFDNVIRNNPEFIADMPKAVKDYFGYTNTPGGGTLRITKR